MKKKLKIGITYDTAEMYGISDKHYDFAEEISIADLGEQLEKIGYEVEKIGGLDSLINKIKTNSLDVDLIYNTAEGFGTRNREGLIPSILEGFKIPYMGTDAFGLSLTLDKYQTKLLAKSLGIRVPADVIIRYKEMLNTSEIDKKIKNLNYPIIIKPNLEGNSSGIEKIDTYSRNTSKIIYEKLQDYKTDILCEEFILGEEVTVPVVGNETFELFGIVGIDRQKNNMEFWLNSNLKLNGDYENIILELSPDLEEKFQEITQKLFIAIGCKDFARFDFRLTQKNEIYFIEANPLPALYKGGSFDIVGHEHNLDYSGVLNLMIEVAQKRLSMTKI